MITLKPKIPESYYIRGEAYLHAKQWEEAKRGLTAAILQKVDISENSIVTTKYYENEELSSGLASRLAGVSREEFWYLMGNYRLSLFGTAGDLKAELENVRKTENQNYKGQSYRGFTSPTQSHRSRCGNHHPV